MSMRFLPFLLVLSLVAVCMEVDLSAPSFPAIVRSLGTTDGLVQMTIAINFIGFALSGLLYGPLSDAFGRRKVMIYGNGLLLLGASGCVFAPTIEWLLVSRFIQGTGAAASAVIAFAMVADAYQDEKASHFIGIMNSALTACMAIAPILGSFIFNAVGWRGSYGSVALLCLVSWILFVFYLPETKPEMEPLRLKKILSDYVTLITNKTFVAMAFVPNILCAGYFSFIACSPFWYMDEMGLSVIQYALYQGSIVATFALVSILSSRLITRFGPRKNIIWGMITSATGASLMLLMGLMDLKSIFGVTLMMNLFAAGFAAIYPVVFAHSLNMFPLIRGATSSMLMATRLIIMGGGVALGSFLYNGQVTSMGLTVTISTVLALVFLKTVLRTQAK